MTAWLPLDELRKLSSPVEPKRIRFIVMGTQLSGYESGGAALQCAALFLDMCPR
jgi:hypothetical protein